MSPRPRLAVAFPLPLERVHMGKDVGLIPEGLRRRGWDVELHCVAADGDDWPMPVRTASLGELATPEYWPGRELDAAVVFTFIAHGDIAHAVRSAGVRTIGKGDTDGLVSPRMYPRETLRETLWHRGGPVWRARSIGSWIARVGPLHGAQVRAVEHAIASSDAFVVETEPARRRIVRVLERHGSPELAARMQTVPNPVGPAFTDHEVPAERDKLIVAVGRWDDPQKNARLLARALSRFLDAHPDHRAHVVGAAADTRFRDRWEGRLAATPHIEQSELASLLGRARIMASSSRWEAASLACFEALACGCTLVGPPLPPFLQAVELGPFGTVADDAGAGGLAAALAREAVAWDAGERDPVAGAAFWRGLVHVDSVAARFEELLTDQGAPERPGRASTSS
jgi:glycosyltransferase involved in cell wall biosynthesis